MSLSLVAMRSSKSTSNSNSSWTWTLATICLSLSSLFLPLVNGKEIIFIAGPHKTGATMIEKFFAEYATGKRSSGLKKWGWPWVQADFSQLSPLDFYMGGGEKGEKFPRYKAFNLLVTARGYDDIQEKILAAIQNCWRKNDAGIVIASEEFDRVGENPHTNFDALSVMENIVEHIQEFELNKPEARRQPVDVKVVLNYRTPRMDQWFSIYRHATQGRQIWYPNFVCDHNPGKVYELLDTAMNPLRLATDYLNSGWPVYLIDLEGVMDNELDLAQVISCEVMSDTICKDGWLEDLFNHSHQELITEYDWFHGISDIQKTEMESMLRGRDCHYQQTLSNDQRFTILYDTGIWDGCQSYDPELYESLADTEYLLNAIRSQKNCSKVDSIKNITEVLTQFKLDEVGGAGGDVQIISQEETKEEFAETQHEEEIMTELAKEPLLSTKSLSTYTPFATLTFLLAGLLVGFFLLLFGRQGKRSTTIDVNGGFGSPNMMNGEVEMESRGNGTTKHRKNNKATSSNGGEEGGFRDEP